MLSWPFEKYEDQNRLFEVGARSAADRLFIGYCPDLFVGGVCHGSEEQKVYRQLTRLMAREIAETEKARRALPRKRALVTIQRLSLKHHTEN